VIRQENIKLIHAHALAPFLHAALARLPYRTPPVLFTEHSKFHIDRPRPHRLLTSRFLLRRGDRIVGVSQAVTQALIANAGVPSNQVEVVYNGVDPAPLLDARRERESARANLGLDPNHFVVIQVSRLVPQKDHATAIRALAHVVRHRQDVRLLFVGEGDELGRIEGLIQHHGLDPYVRCLGFRSDVARLLGAADLALLASNTEGCPLVIAEAMFAGLPVVASQVGGIPEVMKDGETGFLVPVGDDTRMAGQILHLAGDPALRQCMGQAGRQRALSLFSEDGMVANYKRIYGELIQRAEPRG
jgi:glycosyltransferase involved in cell wall biosynthesis